MHKKNKNCKKNVNMHKLQNADAKLKLNQTSHRLDNIWIYRTLLCHIRIARLSLAFWLNEFYTIFSLGRSQRPVLHSVSVSGPTQRHDPVKGRKREGLRRTGPDVLCLRQGHVGPHRQPWVSPGRQTRRPSPGTNQQPVAKTSSWTASSSAVTSPRRAAFSSRTLRLA